MTTRCACGTDCKSEQRADMAVYPDWPKVWNRKLEQDCNMCGHTEPAGGWCSRCGHFPSTAQWHPNTASEAQRASARAASRSQLAVARPPADLEAA